MFTLSVVYITVVRSATADQPGQSVQPVVSMYATSSSVAIVSAVKVCKQYMQTASASGILLPQDPVPDFVPVAAGRTEGAALCKGAFGAAKISRPNSNLWPLLANWRLHCIFTPTNTPNTPPVLGPHPPDKIPPDKIPSIIGKIPPPGLCLNVSFEHQETSVNASTNTVVKRKAVDNLVSLLMLCIITDRVTVKTNHANYRAVCLKQLNSPFVSTHRMLLWHVSVIAAVDLHPRMDKDEVRGVKR